MIMFQNNSPWLHQLKSTRPIDTLTEDIKTDVAIVGAGIAGVMTSYFILTRTDKQVALIEGGRVAHGATGHNAGQLVSEFEREFHSIVQEYGLRKAAQAEEQVRSAWLLIDEVYEKAKLTTPMSTFMGYVGYATIERVLEEMRNNALMIQAGIPVYPIYVADTCPGLDTIPPIYRDFYTVIPHSDILSLLETEDTQYIAAISTKKGCVNGALLVEELTGYLLATYKGRFQLAEQTHIHKVILEKDFGVLEAEKNSITADRIILCTNGFAKFHIKNNAGKDIDTSFHQNVKGSVGYMSGYLEELNRPPTALAYFDNEQIQKGHAEDVFHEPPYFYMTRRPYEIEKDERHNLICAGGPEILIEQPHVYSHRDEFSEEMTKKIDQFLKKTHKHAPKDNLTYRFLWHGLLGYTKSGIRLIGFEPKNPVLMYNLGCNGVGILPSIYGGKRIAQLIDGEKLESSIFDPKDYDA
jgi:glycine/D-amino acid oxidase-like deaminating enzyme